VPVVAELNERPWPLRDDRRIDEHAISPLAGVAGVVAISAKLSGWARLEARRLRRALTVIDVPILVDVDEQVPAAYPTGEPLVVFAGSPVYDDTIRFVFAAMHEAWRARPDCTLVVTGANPSDPASRWLAGEAERVGAGRRLELAGYLERGELLELYGRAHALLIPLFDDVRSWARFPTKIGEYLAAARPIVTSAVGEVPRYFEDGVNAVVCEAGDAGGYGRAIVGLLDDPQTAARIGDAGRRLAESRFHYALHAEALRRGFAAVIGPKAAG
jgi:glycosyltransferase involved in cell wall biosynthesis